MRDMPVATIGDVHDGLLLCLGGEQWLGGVGEVGREGESRHDVCCRGVLKRGDIVKPLPCRLDVNRVEISRRLSRVPVCALGADAGRQPAHFLEMPVPIPQERLDSTMLAEAAFGIELIFAMAKAQQVSLVNIQSNELGEELIQRLVAVRYQQCSLPREAVVNIVDDLRRDISLASTGRSDNDS